MACVTLAHRPGLGADTSSSPGAAEKKPPSANTTPPAALKVPGPSAPGNKPAERYLLDLAEASGSKNVLASIPTNGHLRFTFIRTASAETTATVRLHAHFHGEQSGQELALSPAETDLVFAPRQAAATAAYEVVAPSSNEKYVGTLVLAGDDTPPLLWRVSLTRSQVNVPGPATLEVSQPRLNHSLRSRLFNHAPTPEVIVTLREKEDKWPIEGIHLSPGAINAPDQSGFTFEGNLVWFLNGMRVNGLTQHPPARANPGELALRSIPPGGQAVLGLGFAGVRIGGLAAGDYTVEVNVRAANSLVSEKDQKVVLSLKVAHPWWMAALWLMVALFVSFITHKGIKRYRDQLEVRRRIADSRPDWLMKADPTYAVEWVKTLLRQAEKLTGSFLASPRLAADLVDKVDPVLEALRQAHLARTALREAMPPLVVRRFSAIIDNQIRSMREDKMSAAAANKAAAEMEKLRGELVTNAFPERYGKELQRVVGAFLLGFDPAAIPDFSEAEAEVLRRLRTDNQAESLGSLEDMMKHEERYAKLKLLFEHRRFPAQVAELHRCFGGRLDPFFQVVDEGVWKRMLQQKSQFEIIPPNPSTAPEALQPLTFTLTTGDPGLDQTFLFNHGLSFEWTFELQQPPRHTRTPRSHPALPPQTYSPHVVHFEPKAGQLTVSVKVSRRDGLPPGIETYISVPSSAPTALAKSSTLGLLKNFERSELLSLGCAAVFALVSGLLTFYYKNPIFGSMQDYLSLFLWGVGVDQTKNFLQQLQATSESASP